MTNRGYPTSEQELLTHFNRRGVHLHLRKSMWTVVVYRTPVCGTARCLFVAARVYDPIAGEEDVEPAAVSVA